MAFGDSYVQGQTIFVSGFAPKVVNYSDATYSYTCLAQPFTLINASKWAVFRTETSTGNVTHAAGYLSFSSPATSLAVVAALTYS
jgi:hypothetical protein